MWFIWGTKVFTSFKGYFGGREECPNCHRSYIPSYVKATTWAHFDYIPIFPVKSKYYKMCPICGHNHELKSQEAKALMINMDNGTQQLAVYARHVLHNKPEKKFQIDNSYELWVKDLVTNEDICVATGLTKENIKNAKKNRGIKAMDIIDVQ